MQSRYVSFMSFSGDRSDTCVLQQSRYVSFMSFSGDRSDTCVSQQSRSVSFMSFSGDRSASCPLPGLLPSQESVALQRPHGEMSVTLSVRIQFVTTPSLTLGVTLPSKPGLSSFNLAATASTCFSAGRRRPS